ncbi:MULTISPECIES: hypothetical protein [Fischerella]|uniref:Uncharacterized protein n=1 Tax=Fischerella muscicola CCMEE 5323 TaxID=2019572 RepID=A0A2N6JUP3_FISMU|nr:MULTISPECIES: hypothetical protein [Fischerella]MBD2435181.1 hypothetical protein [Fischerella sp. FACHB-380]PLZ81923.1 hypothetical protein CEN44_28315 [Fischerella muscicola CCMEE 5323]
MNPASIDEWFPIEQQRKYVSQVKGRVGITRRRAECFVKLWAYLFLKQQQELGKQLQLPLTELSLPEGFVACTHREAHELFYSQQERGSDRAAGMMIDKLVALGLIEKEFDGNTTCIRIKYLLPNPYNSENTQKSIDFVPDNFNPRTDAIPVATFLAQNYNWMNKKTTAVPQRIARILRTWAAQYPICMRVLRRYDTQDPVGFYVVYPTARESEEKFFLPPSRSLHLSAATETDPIKMATPGDMDCTSVFVRSFQLDLSHQQHHLLCQLLKDVQKTLIRMQADFPNLCDMYTLAIHPTSENLATAVGFRKTSPDPQLSLYWMYLALDKFLALDIEQAVSTLNLDMN